MGQGAEDLDQRWAWGGRLPPTEPRPTVAPQQWRIEVLNKDGTHHSFVPRFGRGDITAERALVCLNETLDHERFTARVV